MSRKNPGATRRRLAALLAEALPDIDVRPEDLQDAQGWHRSNGHWSNEALRWEAFARTRSTGMRVIFGSHDTMTACVRRGILVSRRGALIAGIEVHARPSGGAT